MQINNTGKTYNYERNTEKHIVSISDFYKLPDYVKQQRFKIEPIVQFKVSESDTVIGTNFDGDSMLAV